MKSEFLRLASWWKDARGGVLILFALVLPVALGIMGLVLDGARSLYLRNRFDHALREATLAAGAAKIESDREKEAKNLFAANFPTNDADSFSPVVDGPHVTVTDSKVRVTASAECPTYFPRIFMGDGQSTPEKMTIRGWYEVDLHDAEVVIVLSTALENWSQVAPELNSALQTMVQQVNDHPVFYNTAWGLVPFSNGVAVGDDLLSQRLTGNSLTPPLISYAPLAGHKWIERTWGRNVVQEDWDPGQTTWQTWDPSHVAYMRWDTYYDNQSAQYWKLHERGIPLQPWREYTDSFIVQNQIFGENRYLQKDSDPYTGSYHAYPLLLARINAPYETVGSETTDASIGLWVPFYIYGDYVPRPMWGLRENATVFQQKLHETFDLSSTPPQGNQLPNLGMIWGLRMLSPAWRGQWLDSPDTSIHPADDRQRTKKIIILISSDLTKVSPEIVSQGGNLDPASYISNDVERLRNAQYHFELYKNLHEARDAIGAPLGADSPVNIHIPESLCGNRTKDSCASMLDTQYQDAIAQINTNFSSSLIDQILYRRTIKYLWDAYLNQDNSIPYARPGDENYQNNWNWILWDRDTLISSVKSNVTWGGKENHEYAALLEEYNAAKKILDDDYAQKSSELTNQQLTAQEGHQNVYEQSKTDLLSQYTDDPNVAAYENDRQAREDQNKTDNNTLAKEEAEALANASTEEEKDAITAHYQSKRDTLQQTYENDQQTLLDSYSTDAEGNTTRVADYETKRSELVNTLSTDAAASKNEFDAAQAALKNEYDQNILALDSDPKYSILFDGLYKVQDENYILFNMVGDNLNSNFSDTIFGGQIAINSSYYYISNIYRKWTDNLYYDSYIPIYEAKTYWAQRAPNPDEWSLRNILISAIFFITLGTAVSLLAWMIPIGLAMIAGLQAGGTYHIAEQVMNTGLVWDQFVDSTIHTMKFGELSMRLGLTKNEINSKTVGNDKLIEHIYANYQKNGGEFVSLGEVGELGSLSDFCYTYWRAIGDPASSPRHKRYEKSLQIMNAQQYFLDKTLKSENDYIKITNTTSNEIADLEYQLWNHIPVYGFLGVAHNINGAPFDGSFHINGQKVTTKSAAISSLNTAYQDVCTYMKDKERNIMVYTLNISSSGKDRETMKASATSTLHYFEANPLVPGSVQEAVEKLKDDLVARGLKATLTGKSS